VRRLLAGALAVSLVGAGAAVGVATGQGTGGTVGAGAVGTKSFEVRVKQNQIGVNCGRPAPPQCFRRGPRLANVIAGNGAIYDGTTRVGTALFANIVGRKVGRNGTQEVFLATITFDNRTDSISVLGPATSQGDTALPYAIIGGTGIYAGARGTVSEGRSTDTRTETRIPLNFTFIP
jgi:hypothetical protein